RDGGLGRSAAVVLGGAAEGVPTLRRVRRRCDAEGRMAALSPRRRPADDKASCDQRLPMSEGARFPLPTPEIHVWVAYLTARCNFACTYCIQKPSMVPGERRRPWGRYDELSGRQWVEALNAFPVRPEHPLILTGGEPSLHNDFAFVASRLEGYALDMTSNLTFDVAALAREMNAHGRKFATSFHTYHPKFLSPEKWLDQAERLRDSGIVERPTFSMVNLQRFPHFRDDEHDRNVRQLVELADRRGLAYQFKEFRRPPMGAPF